MYKRICDFWEANKEWTPRSYWMATLMLIAIFYWIYSRADGDENLIIFASAIQAVLWSVFGIILFRRPNSRRGDNKNR